MEEADEFEEVAGSTQNDLLDPMSFVPEGKVYQLIEAAELTHSIDRELYALLCKPYDSISRQETPDLFQAETSMLGLAAHELCESLFYMMPMLMSVSGTSYWYVRYFEHGLLKGFYQQHGSVLLERMLPEQAPVVAVQVFTDWDVLAEKKHRRKNRTNETVQRPRKAYKGLLEVNDSSIKKKLPLASVTIGRQLTAPGFVIWAQEKTKNPQDGRYLSAQGYGESSEWEKAILMYTREQQQSSSTDFDFLKEFSWNRTQLSLQQQFRILSSVPNFHRWMAKKNSGVKKEVYFSLRPGRTPRTKFILALLDGTGRECQSVLQDVDRDHFHIDPPENPATNSRKRKQGITGRRKVLSKEQLLDVLQINATDLEVLAGNQATKRSFYEEYKDFVLNNGTLAWRVHNGAVRNIISVNDFDTDTGQIKANEYVHVSQTMLETGSHITCTCNTYRILKEAARLCFKSPSLSSWEGVSCCHGKLLLEILEQVLTLPPEGDSSLPDHEYFCGSHLQKSSATSKLESVVLEALTCCTSPVLRLPCNDNRVIKYSVVTHEQKCEFVHMFPHVSKERYMVACQSGLCQHAYGKRKGFESLQTATDICAHLCIMRDGLREEDLPQADESLSGDSDNEAGSSDNEQEDGDEMMPSSSEPCEAPNIPGLMGAGLPQAEWDEVFNPEDGKWCFSSKFGHEVDPDPFSPKLSEYDRKRSQMTDGPFPRDGAGCLDGGTIFVSTDSKECYCDSVWCTYADGQYKYFEDGTTTLYTSYGPVKFKVTCLLCEKVFNCLRIGKSIKTGKLFHLLALSIFAIFFIFWWCLGSKPYKE